MMTEGIITAINESGTEVSCTVEVPIFKNPGDDFEPEVYKVGIALPPGMGNGYKVNDKVIVDFMNNSYDHIIIVGKIYVPGSETALKTMKNAENVGSLSVEDLSVSRSASIPFTTTFIQSADLANDPAPVVAATPTTNSAGGTLVTLPLTNIQDMIDALNNQYNLICVMQNDIAQLQNSLAYINGVLNTLIK